MTGQPSNTQRRAELRVLTRALREHLEWQRELGADGAPASSTASIESLDSRIVAAREAARVRALEPPPSVKLPTTQDAREEHVAVDTAVSLPLPPAEISGETEERPHGIYKAKRLLMSSNELEAVTRDRPASTNAAMDRVVEDLGDCTRCPLSNSRTQLVFGAGDPFADLVFVGGAPGFHEDRHGRPFAGGAEKLLTRMISAMGLRSQDVYLCNVLKCRPPGGRAPSQAEISTCKPFLIKQLSCIKPKIIVALGETAAQTLLREQRNIEDLRGKWFKRQGIRIMPTFHPARLVRDASDKRLVWQDLKMVMAALEAS